MKNLLKEVAALKFTPWYRWHPQIAMRYLPAVERIREEGRRKKEEGKRGEPLSILEAGSGGLGIAPYLKMAVTGVDREFQPPFHPLLKRVVGDATDLKFGDDSFDVTVSMDMLEHLPKNKRETAIREMMRVARKLAVIGVPCGKEAGEHDREMKDKKDKKDKRDKTRLRLGLRRGEGDRGFKFLEEQVEYGLPEEIDILYYIKAAARESRKEIEVEIKGNMNIKLREILMWGWMNKNIIINIIFRKVFLMFIPLFMMVDRPPFYRKIFFISLKRSDLGVRQGRTLIYHAYRD